MKVLHLVKTSVGAKWALRQMKELTGMGVEVHVAMPTDGPLVEEYKEAGIYVHGLNYSLPGFFSACRRLRKIVREVEPDLIHSHFVLTTLVMRLGLLGDRRPRIFQVPGPLHLESPFFRTLDVRTARKNDYWVGSCKWTNERYAASGVARDRLFLSYYGGDIMRSGCRSVGKIHSELGLPSEAVVVGMVAYMYAPKRLLGQKRGLKGHEDFIDAIATVVRKHPEVYGVCIGAAWGKAAETYEKRIKEYARRLTDHVLFMGNRPDVPELYADMYCVVHPSHSENLGGAGESLILGVPTIATRVGGFPDIVIDGKTGVLVPPKSPEDLARAINDMIEGRYDLKEMSENGKILVSDMLDVRNTAVGIYEIYRHILRK